MYTVQATYIARSRDDDGRPRERIEQIRWNTGGDQRITRVVEEVVAVLAEMPLAEGEDLFVRDITLRPLLWSRRSLEECEGGLISREAPAHG